MNCLKFFRISAAVFSAAFFTAGFMSCSSCVLPDFGEDSDSLTIMSYNLQNIFDDVDNGSEYPEFDPGEGEWDASLYHSRLFNLAEVIGRSVDDGPDIIAFQEIENSNVAEDLTENYLKGMGYSYLAVTNTADSAIQLGVISRLEIKAVRIHEIYSDGDSPGRPVLEVEINTDSGTLYLFNNHWKSKLGGAEETESQRIAAAAALGSRIRALVTRDDSAEIIIAGDLNENWDEYSRTDGAYLTALVPVDTEILQEEDPPILITGDHGFSEDMAGTDSVVLFDSWLEGSEENGSYVYNAGWETIDHIMLTSGFFDGKGYRFEGFKVVDDSFLLDSSGYPDKWNTASAGGYSDHLPLVVTITLD